MTTIYWIEDITELLSWFEGQLIKRRYTLVKLRDAAGVLRKLTNMSDNPGIVLLDLYLPPGDSGLLPDGIKGPEVGMWLLGELQRRLGRTYPVVILSGNLGADIIERLRGQYSIPPEAIFPKPLVEPDAIFAYLRERESDIPSTSVSDTGVADLQP